MSAPDLRCPICNKPREARFKPFCSQRCAEIDLSRWLKGVYAVPVVEGRDTPPSEPEPPYSPPDKEALS